MIDSSQVLHRTTQADGMAEKHAACEVEVTGTVYQLHKIFADRWFYTFMLPCIVIGFFLNKQQDALIIQIYSVIKL